MDEKDKRGSPQKQRKNILIRIAVIATIVFGIMFFGGLNAKNRQNEITIDELARMIQQKETVQSITIQSGTIRIITIKNEKETLYMITTVKEPSIEKMMTQLERMGTEKQSIAAIKWQEKYSFSDYAAKYGSTIFFVFLFLLFFLWMRNKGGMNPFQTKTKQFAQEEHPKITFNDVAGVEEAKSEVRDIVEFLRNPEKFKAMGGRIPKGILLIGPPGTGKTLLARAIAGEAGVPFFICSASDFVEMFVGLGASRVRALFAQAKKFAPSIIFIDELDALGKKRGTSNFGGNDEREQTLNAILTEMDGFEQNTGIIVIGATNRHDVLDPALLRPGRFDRTATLNIPFLRDREAILRVHTRNKTVHSEINLLSIAQKTFGCSGADLENITNEAAILAVKEPGCTSIMQRHLELAVEKILIGPERKSLTISDEGKRRLAYHEAGHAIVAYELEKETNRLVQKITITPRGMAGGYTLIVPVEDEVILTETELIAQIKFLYGSYVAEHMIFKNNSQGVQDDLKRAHEIARKMVTQWGMTSDGPTTCIESGASIFENYEGQSYSEKRKMRIDDAVEGIERTAWKDARIIVEKYPDQLDALADELLDKEVIDRQDLERIMKSKLN